MLNPIFDYAWEQGVVQFIIVVSAIIFAARIAYYFLRERHHETITPQIIPQSISEMQQAIPKLDELKNELNEIKSKVSENKQQITLESVIADMLLSSLKQGNFTPTITLEHDGELQIFDKTFKGNIRITFTKEEKKQTREESESSLIG
jgi:hypothetical protein